MLQFLLDFNLNLNYVYNFQINHELFDELLLTKLETTISHHPSSLQISANDSDQLIKVHYFPIPTVCDKYSSYQLSDSDHYCVYSIDPDYLCTILSQSVCLHTASNYIQ